MPSRLSFLSSLRRPAPGALLVVACLVATTTGCGRRSDVGRVSGVVTLDGTPLAGALVTFQPTTGGAPSHALTDATGRYDLQYSRSVAGARVGDHEVTITTLDKGNPDADPPRPPRPEQLPRPLQPPHHADGERPAGRDHRRFPAHRIDGPERHRPAPPLTAAGTAPASLVSAGRRRRPRRVGRGWRTAARRSGTPTGWR